MLVSKVTSEYTQNQNFKKFFVPKYLSLYFKYVPQYLFLENVYFSLKYLIHVQALFSLLVLWQLNHILNFILILEGIHSFSIKALQNNRNEVVEGLRKESGQHFLLTSIDIDSSVKWSCQNISLKCLLLKLSFSLPIKENIIRNFNLESYRKLK